MISDLRFTFRQWTKNPAFTAAIVLILALGIGANTAIFTVIDSVMLSTLPVKDPQHLVILTDPNFHGVITGGSRGERTSLTYGEFEDLRDHNSVFSGLLAASAQVSRLDATIEGAGAPISGGRILVSMVSGNYFSVLGVKALIGNTFTAAVDRTRDANPVAVISYAYWKDQLGGDPEILTRRIRLNKTSFSVIGVAPPGFFGETYGSVPSLWVPLTMQPEVRLRTDFLSLEQDPGRKIFWLQVIGRLKPGLSFGQARAGIETTFHQYLASQLPQLPQHAQAGFMDQHIPLTDGSHGASAIRQSVDAPLVFLMALVSLLLLIACANVANLLLARAMFRQKEVGIRVAMGAKPSRIVRQLLTESTLLSVLGGAAGLLVARWGDALLLRMVGTAAGDFDLHLDTRILLFTLGVSMLVGVIFGLAPAFSATRINLVAMLKGVGGPEKPGRFVLGRVLVVTQIALSLLLLIVAGLFGHSFQKLAAVELGYDRNHLLTFGVPAAAAGFKGAEMRQLYDTLAERLRDLPKVRAVSYSMFDLLSGGESNVPISIDGIAGSSRDMSANCDRVGPNYFTTIGIPILLGREIRPQDEGNGQRVAVINRTMAQYYFGDSNPVGRRISIPDDSGSAPLDLVIVGVAADAKYHAAKEKPVRRLYVPFFGTFEPTDAAFEIRTSGDPTAVVDAIRATVGKAAPSLPTIGVRIISQIADRQLNPDLILARLSGFFSILAAVLASTGIYGLMSYAVARRTREVGIRMALGAQRGNVLWLILSDTVLLALIGVLIGIPASIGAGKLLSSLLFGLGAADVPVLAAAAALMVAVAAAAGYLPARRATKVDPMVALRSE